MADVDARHELLDAPVDRAGLGVAPLAVGRDALEAGQTRYILDDSWRRDLAGELVI